MKHKVLYKMKNLEIIRLKKSVRVWLICFVVLLILSGITAFPLETELAYLNKNSFLFPESIQQWIFKIYISVKNTNEHYPQLAYGTDWLAFAHIIITVAFFGPLKDPVKNRWVIQFGMISCLMVFPLAFICGPIRSIPLYWQFIDCSFGIFGLIPLYICNKRIKRIEFLEMNSNIVSTKLSEK